MILTYKYWRCFQINFRLLTLKKGKVDFDDETKNMTLQLTKTLEWILSAGFHFNTE